MSNFILSKIYNLQFTVRCKIINFLADDRCKLTLDDSNMVHEIITVRDSERITITVRVRQIRFSYNGFKGVRLTSIWVIEGQNSFY